MLGLSTTYTKKKTLDQPNTYYIVKDDFIVNLKRGRNNKNTMPLERTSDAVPLEVANSEIMIRKKYELQSRLRDRSSNNFYNLERQI